MKKFKELLFLKQLKGIGKITINKKYISLLENINSMDECIKLISDNEAKLSKSDIIKAISITEDKYKKIMDYKDIHIVTVFDDEYPKQLNDLKEKRPVILYVKGKIETLKEKSIAVVGTRNPSLWSEKIEYRLVQKIIELSGNTIISGLALGCDKIAHEATVKLNAHTVAVLPSGVNVITPISHKKLANSILDNGGCLISEYEPDDKVTRSTYVERDAVIAALADITFVVECGIKSGTMHTVDAAVKMNRKLACYYINNESKGKYDGNKLMIETKNAIKVSDTDELIKMLNKIDNKKLNQEKEIEQLSMFNMQLN